MSDSGDVTANVTFSLDYWVFQLRSRLLNHLGMLRIFLSTLDDGSYLERISPRPQEGVMSLVLSDMAPPEKLAKWARREAVLSMARSVVEFIDTMIAIKRLKTFELTRDANSEEDLRSQLMEAIDSETRKVSTDKNLTIPKKRAFFKFLDVDMSDAFDAMFKIRNGLEHHQAIANGDIQLSSRGFDIVVNDSITVEELGHTLAAGDTLRLKPQDKGRLIRLGEEIDPTEQEIKRMLMHITTFLVPQLLREDSQPVSPKIQVGAIAYDKDGNVVPLDK
jgi:hypothetical protein